MHVRVDQRGQRNRRIHLLVQLQTQLAQDRKIRPEAGAGDNLIKWPQHTLIVAVNIYLLADAFNAFNFYPCLKLNQTAGNHALGLFTQCATLAQLIIAQPAKHLAGLFAPHRPGDARVGRLLHEVFQINNGIECRMPAADDENMLARVTRTICAQHIGNAIRDAILIGLLAQRPCAVGSQWVGRLPSAGGVNHGLRHQRGLALLSLQGEDKWRTFTPVCF